MKVFISYSHKQGPWVWKRLKPVLEAAGVTVLIDKDRFTAGLALFTQMDALQDQSDVTLLVLSPDYDASRACLHERDRAIAADPLFQQGKVLPVVRVSGADMTPFTSTAHTPLWVDMKDDRATDKWSLLLTTLKADQLRACPVHWLEVRDELLLKIHDQSVNLIIRQKPNWQGLFDHLQAEHLPGIAVVDLDNPATITRQGLVSTLLTTCGHTAQVPRPPGDLAALNVLLLRSTPAIVALQHFEHVAKRSKTYGDELFNALRFFIEQRKLVLLIESRLPFRDLLPAQHLLSNLQVHHLELIGSTP